MKFRIFTFILYLYLLRLYYGLPCRQRCLSGMAFSIYEVLEVVRVPCQSRSWFVFMPRTT